MKKILWILGTVLACMLYAFIVGIMFVIGNIVISICTRSEIQSINQAAFNVVMYLGWAVFAVTSVMMWKRFSLKCHACKRWNALTFKKTEIIKQENISVIMELEHRNLNRQVTGTHDQYIPGKRKTYQDTYICKYCGSLESRTYTKDKASI